MKPQRVYRSGDDVPPAATDPQAQADGLLAEIAGLYRERFRALYNNDQPALKTINEKIELLKSRLPNL